MSETKGTSRKEVLEMLKLEMGMVRDGGYAPSVRTPRATPTIFRDSVVCLNFGKTEDETWEACERCWLVQFVPRQHRNRLLACHFIPLNEQGETLASLEAAGDRERTEQVLHGWLRARLAEAEKEEGCAHDNESSYAEQIPRAGY
jgi:hypothetical protein